MGVKVLLRAQRAQGALCCAPGSHPPPLRSAPPPLGYGGTFVRGVPPRQIDSPANLQKGKVGIRMCTHQKFATGRYIQVESRLFRGPLARSGVREGPKETGTTYKFES